MPATGGQPERLTWHSSQAAPTAVPTSAYEAASAFANTGGGTIVFGVRDRDRDGEVEVVGVDRVDKVQNEFLSTIRSGQKLSRSIEVDADAIEVDGKTLLAFFIPESPRSRKPVYLDGNPNRTFIRRGGCNERCRRSELEHFLRDAAEDRYDSRVLGELEAHEFFDPDSVRWYRSAFFDRNPGRHQSFTDVEFLHEWGFVVECGDRLAPTRAAVLIFGRPRYLRQILPRPVIDCQFIGASFAEWSPDHRWADRIVVEKNLLQAWLILSERYLRHADRPFSLDMQTLRRNDHPPDYVSFREAVINQLIHQDYGDHGRTAFIRFYQDRTVFWNPGDAHASTDKLLDPTAKEVRNPSIVAALRRIGLSEQAGTGVRAIFRNWRRLGNVPPLIRNDKAHNSFELELVRPNEEQRLFPRLGVRLERRQVPGRQITDHQKDLQAPALDASALAAAMGGCRFTRRRRHRTRGIPDGCGEGKHHGGRRFVPIPGDGRHVPARRSRDHGQCLGGRQGHELPRSSNGRKAVAEGGTEAETGKAPDGETGTGKGVPVSIVGADLSSDHWLESGVSAAHQTPADLAGAAGQALFWMHRTDAPGFSHPGSHSAVDSYDPSIRDRMAAL